MKLIVEILVLIISILIYGYVNDDSLMVMTPKLYFCVFGAAYIGIKFKVWKINH